MTDVSPVLERALAERYRIDGILGAGGMATVYLAEDLKHKRPVALKVLRPELAHALGPERFAREVETAARLQHPHILAVHDSGEVDGQLWFTMPYVEGESLRDRLERERQLPVADAVRIARETADALEYAHRHGVIHRDIKPENILLADGHALVADFGIARALGTGAAGGKLTQTGTSVGTAAYMSPEQAAGESDVDARSDVYSLGIVLYEMLAGETPFQAATPQAMIARRFTETPKPLRSVRDSVPAVVERAVEQALARTAADRLPTARAFRDALEPAIHPAEPPVARVDPARPASRFRIQPSLAMLLLGLVIGTGILFAWRESSRPDTPAAHAVTRLAVLPFENLGDSTDEYFADGLTDEVRGKLAGLTGLQVTARSSSAEYKHTGKSPQEIGQELGVEYLLTGTVRWVKGDGEESSRVRVSPELIAVSTGATDWQQPFEASLTDVFRVQADIAGRVAGALDVALGTTQQQALALRPTASLAAYDSYLQGLAERSRGSAIATLREALGHFERAVAQDSSFVGAWAGISDASSLLYAQSLINSGLDTTAKQAADRALALAPDRADGYRVLGDYYRRVPQVPRLALEPYRRGLALAPTDADLLRGLALAEQGIGNWDRGLEHLVRSQSIDPRSSLTAEALGNTYVWLRRYPEAIAALDLSLALQPGNLGALQGKAMAFIGQNNLPAARALLSAAPPGMDAENVVAYLSTYWDMYWVLSDSQQAILRGLPAEAFDSDASWGLALAGAHEVAGDMQRARAYADAAHDWLTSSIGANPEDAQSHVLLGVALAYLGRRDDAIRSGEHGVALQPPSRDAVSGPYYEHQLARIYTLLGEQEKAIGKLERLLDMPYYLSRGWLRVDPTFKSLRGNPRFERLLSGS